MPHIQWKQHRAHKKNSATALIYHPWFSSLSLELPPTSHQSVLWTFLSLSSLFFGILLSFSQYSAFWTLNVSLVTLFSGPYSLSLSQPCLLDHSLLKIINSFIHSTFFLLFLSFLFFSSFLPNFSPKPFLDAKHSIKIINECWKWMGKPTHPAI